MREDSRDVDTLQRLLEAAGVRVWRDTSDLWPGEDWRANIRHAIAKDAFVFIACFSSHGVSRAKSYQNEELLLAVDQLRLRRPDVPWLIPVRLDNCSIPDMEIGGGRTLSSIQGVDLFGNNRDEGIARLVSAVLRVLIENQVEHIDRRQDSDIRERSTRTVREPTFPHDSAPEQLREPAARPTGTKTHSPSGDNPLEFSGENSRLLKIDLPVGRYNMIWKMNGKGIFSIRDESARSGRGALLANGVARIRVMGKQFCE